MSASIRRWSEEFARESGQEYLAWDNYRRFLQSWAMTAGVHRENFQDLMDRAKARHGVAVKRQFTPDADAGAGPGLPED